MIHGIDLAGTRFPRSMLNSAANERLLEAFGVEIVDDRDCELEDYARAWLAQVDGHDWGKFHPATSAVRRALKTAERRAA